MPWPTLVNGYGCLVGMEDFRDDFSLMEDLGMYNIYIYII